MTSWRALSTSLTSGMPTQSLADAGLLEHFQAQVIRSPDALCLADERQRLTYAEADAQSNRAARALDAHGCRPGSVVGVLASPGADLVIAILGIVKAGAAYLPIDPRTPAERVRYMLSDAGAGLLVIDDCQALLQPSVKEVRLDRATLQAVDAAPLGRRRRDDDVVYVMYTSGSTGAPKGITIPDRAVRRLVVDTNYVSLGHGDRMAQASNPAFDAATFEIWGALLNGASLHHLPHETLLSTHALRTFLRDERITVLFLTTALFNQHVREAPGLFASLDTLLFGGEACDPRAVRVLLGHSAPRRLLHVYGPTETTTFATFHQVTHVPSEAMTIPIGRPIRGTTVHVLDEDLQPIEDGSPGEIVLGGQGVALGYLGHPELSAERFVADPSSAEPGARMYRTGDRGRILPDGDLEILGRLDQQVKIRGYRIELGDVEAALRSLSGVRDAVVTVREDRPGDRRLVGYVVGVRRLPAADLLHTLRAVLPPYMVPSAFVILDALPLNVNGKVDRSALPPPVAIEYMDDDAPQGATATAAAAIWAEVLGIPGVGAHANFFALGGDSLLAAQVIARARARFGIEVSLRSVFEASTLADWAVGLELAQLQAADETDLLALVEQIESAAGVQR